MIVDDFTSAENLIEGFKKVKKASGWKTATQRFELNLLKEIKKLQQELRDGTYKPNKPNSFLLNEHGRMRIVKALKPRDMVVNHSLCNTVLVPILSKYLIHDNGASLKGKGISFTRRRFEEHLRWHFKKYGNKGYALKIDFRKYFDNIRHDVLMKKIEEHIQDETVLRTLRIILKANEIDISFTDDDNYINEVFNSLDYEKISKSLLTGKRFMKKSMGVGVPTAQISGIFLPTEIDNYCKTVKRLKCYDAYMDDRIILHPDKEFLKELLKEITAIANKLGIHINKKKTQIVKLSKGVTFLKTKYTITETGRIIKRIPRDVITRERRKLKKLAKFTKEGKLDIYKFEQLYKSWRGDKTKFNAYETLKKLDELYLRLEKEILDVVELPLEEKQEFRKKRLDRNRFRKRRKKNGRNPAQKTRNR